MTPLRTFQGLEATLRVRGGGRFGTVAFLLFWLTFWVLGEVVVTGILVLGGWALVSGEPPQQNWAPLRWGPSLLVGLFLCAWLAFWTFGGIVAGREVLLLLFGRDRLVAGPDALWVERSFGLFRTRRIVPRGRIRRLEVRGGGRKLFADTEDGAVELTRLGEPRELAALAAAFNAELKIDATAARGAGLPRGWVEELSPEGEPILRRDPVKRRRLGTFVGGLAAVLGFVAVLLVHESFLHPSWGVMAALVTAAAGFAGWGARRLRGAHEEWRLGPGRLEHRWRKRGAVTERFEAVRLVIRLEKDSDGDPWHRLVATDGVMDGRPRPGEARRHERLLLARSGDDDDVRDLARWLEERCRLPLVDETTPAAKAEELERLKAQLAASGRFGRWVARRLGARGAPEQ